MKHITSPDNPQVKLINELKFSKGRTKHQLFIAEGLRTCMTFLKAHYVLYQLYLTQEAYQHNKSFLAEHEHYITIVSHELMKKLSTAHTPSGILGVFHIPLSPSPEALGSGLVLAQVSDPGNMGTLIRTAAACGSLSVVIVDGCDPWSPKVVQASAGSHAFVKIFTFSWEELVAHKHNLKLCALVVSGGKSPKELTFENTLLVVGSEAHGIPHQWLAQCDEFLTLPMQGATESLNAAIAGSIALYYAFVKL